ncbi:MAG: hypothetical protein II670_07255 [Alphaproteobacteria bacterium]|nr:hypothetical protein [Alphaproteobacteria bacterium]
MSLFIVTTRDKNVSLKELQHILDRHFNSSYSPSSYSQFCEELISWIKRSLDYSFSNIRSVIDDCHTIIGQGFSVYNMAWHNITHFLFHDLSFLPYARNLDDWPSCKHLLNLSPKEIIEIEKDLIKDEQLKQAIKQVLNLDTALNVINVVTLADFYACLLTSIKGEILKCCDDPWGNKQRLHNKFSKELDYCVQVLCKIGQDVVCDKFKEMLKEKHEELNSNGWTNNTIFVPKERIY